MEEKIEAECYLKYKHFLTDLIDNNKYNCELFSAADFWLRYKSDFRTYNLNWDRGRTIWTLYVNKMVLDEFQCFWNGI